MENARPAPARRLVDRFRAGVIASIDAGSFLTRCWERFHHIRGGRGMDRHPIRAIVFALAVIALFVVNGESTGEDLVHLSTPPRAVSSILLEASTGQVLYERDADLPRPPASIAKLMLELIVLEKVEQGAIRLDSPITVSAWASKLGGSQVYLAHGEVFPLEDLLKAIVISSANDACVAVAERIAGSAEGFVDLMNLRARDLGLENTHYINVHGLDDEPGRGNVTTARDIALVARELVRHPDVLRLSKIEEAPFRDGEFLLQNTNKLVGRFAGLDGLKTGYTRKAGFCLCATAERNGLRLISVILGADSNRLRFDETARLLGAGFAQLRMETVVAEGDSLPGTVPVIDGRTRTVEAVAAERIAVVLQERDEAPAAVLVPRPALRAPIARGDTVGTIEVRMPDGKVRRAAALSAADVPEATIFQRIGRFFGGSGE
ncbi:MAG: D-alanyl-D-alanine carboxypeptidase [Candidatus Eisenbacteria bacterium]|nr:D-alanyl-D-alanine carboxypeptidase [Candidatus Latescibacterota bacterium]MBD3303320.1 D-alanyl-D-alanine carboxypeptidase [Candidatus Eisenbacteria bacterium]